MERDLLIERLAKLLPDEVETCWLFGSRARGTERPDSDVDVAIAQSTDRTMADLFTLEAELELALGHQVQVVDVARVDGDLGKRILRDGILVRDRHPSRRIAWTVRTRNAYWDMEPIRRRYRKLS